jgi:6-pyruvoyl-tetrahydropterin synthase
MAELDTPKRVSTRLIRASMPNRFHGHTWFVRIYWPSSPPKDARFMQARLKQYLEAAFDHRMLDDVIDDPTNIGVARAIWQLMGDDLKRIQVWRSGNCPCGALIER